MASNVEIKARLRDPFAVKRLLESIADAPPEALQQEDTFFQVSGGRLKLRRLGPERGELIHYHRADVPGPRLSEYLVSKTRDPGGLRDILGAVLGIRGVVRKSRQVYLMGRTRVHLDMVEGLGDFIELEVVLEPNQTGSDGAAIAHGLMARLGIGEKDLIEGAYIDLLERSGAT